MSTLSPHAETGRIARAQRLSATSPTRSGRVIRATGKIAFSQLVPHLWVASDVSAGVHA